MQELELSRKKRLSIHHLRVIKTFSSEDYVRVVDIERFLTSFVSPQTARKLISQMIDLELIFVTANIKDRRSKLVHFKCTEACDLL